MPEIRFWRELFEMAKTRLLGSTVYCISDGQSERTNQTTEIVLRYYVSLHQTDCPDHLPSIQASINQYGSTGIKWQEFLLYFTSRFILFERQVRICMCAGCTYIRRLQVDPLIEKCMSLSFIKHNQTHFVSMLKLFAILNPSMLKLRTILNPKSFLNL